MEVVKEVIIMLEAYPAIIIKDASLASLNAASTAECT